MTQTELRYEAGDRSPDTVKWANQYHWLQYLTMRRVRLLAARAILIDKSKK